MYGLFYQTLTQVRIWALSNNQDGRQDDRHLFVCLFVWCLTTHQSLWVIGVRRYLTKHDVDGKSKNVINKME